MVPENRVDLADELRHRTEYIRGAGRLCAVEMVCARWIGHHQVLPGHCSFLYLDESTVRRFTVSYHVYHHWSIYACPYQESTPAWLGLFSLYQVQYGAILVCSFHGRAPRRRRVRSAQMCSAKPSFFTHLAYEDRSRCARSLQYHCVRYVRILRLPASLLLALHPHPPLALSLGAGRPSTPRGHRRTQPMAVTMSLVESCRWSGQSAGRAQEAHMYVPSCIRSCTSTHSLAWLALRFRLGVPGEAVLHPATITAPSSPYISLSLPA